MRGATSGLAHYLRSEQDGLGDANHTMMWDLAHQYQLILARAIKTFNAQRAQIYVLLYWIAKKGQQFTKQSPRRHSILVEIMVVMQAASELKMKKVFVVRFVESEQKAFQALLHMLPYLHAFCNDLIERNTIKIGKKVSNSPLLKKENIRLRHFQKKSTQARVLAFLAAQCDNHDSVHVPLSKTFQSEQLIATDLPNIIVQKFEEKLRPLSLGVVVSGGHVARLLGSRHFFRRDNPVYTNTDGAEMPVTWTGKKKNTQARKKYVLDTVKYIAKTTLESRIKAPSGDDDEDDGALFNLFNEESDDDEEEEMEEEEEEEEEREEEEAGATKCELIGPFLVPVEIKVMATVLNVHLMPFVLQNKEVPENFCHNEIRYLQRNRWSYVSLTCLEVAFHAFWNWACQNKSKFMEYDDSDVLKLFPKINHKSMFQHL